MAFRLRLNPLTATPNSIELAKGTAGCCGDGLDVCKYETDIPDDETLLSLTYTNAAGESVVVTLEDPVDLTESAGVIAKAITNALRSEGITMDDSYPHVLVYTNADASPVTIGIGIFTDFAITALTTDEGAETPDVQCIPTVACRYEFDIENDSDVDLVIDDVILEDPQTVSNLDTSTGSAANDAVAAAIGGALDTLYGDNYKRIFVKYDNYASVHKVSFWLYGRENQPIVNIEAAGNVVLTISECRQDYTTT